MTAYFDEAREEIGNSLEQAIAVEARLIQDVNLVTGDREFPDDLREKIQTIIATCRIDGPSGRNETIASIFRRTRHSMLLTELHNAFHYVAQRRIKTRFGTLSDSPRQILKGREMHDVGECTGSTCPARGMDTGPCHRSNRHPCHHPMAERVIHILNEGKALCGQEGLPSSWPEGHRWVSVAHYIEAQGMIGCMCPGCERALAERGATAKLR